MPEEVVGEGRLFVLDDELSQELDTDEAVQAGNDIVHVVSSTGKRYIVMSFDGFMAMIQELARLEAMDDVVADMFVLSGGLDRLLAEQAATAEVESAVEAKEPRTILIVGAVPDPE